MENEWPHDAANADQCPPVNTSDTPNGAAPYVMFDPSLLFRMKIGDHLKVYFMTSTIPSGFDAAVIYEIPPFQIGKVGSSRFDQLRRAYMQDFRGNK